MGHAVRTIVQGMSRSFTKRPLVGLLLLGLIAVVGLQSCLSTYFYDVAIARRDKSFLQKSPDLKPAKAAGIAGTAAEAAPPLSIWEEGRAWLDVQAPETVTLTSDDGLRLQGYWLAASPASSRTVILAHGYSADAKSMAVFARHWVEAQGCNVLLPDARGHGASEGDYIGFGWPERRDWVRWIQWVDSRVGPASSVVLHGVSMGGATVMMTSGEADLPRSVKAVVEDCGYTSVRDQLSWNLVRMYKLEPEPIISDTSRLTRQRAGYSFDEASALNQVKRARVPSLFIHGDADTFVPFDMVQRLYAACSSEKALFVVPGAGHGQSMAVDPQGYWRAVADFTGTYF